MCVRVFTGVVEGLQFMGVYRDKTPAVTFPLHHVAPDDDEGGVSTEASCICCCRRPCIQEEEEGEERGVTRCVSCFSRLTG